MSDVVINGVRLDPPLALDLDEVDRLAHYNTESGRGVAFTAEVAAEMAQLQLRFDWLGYFSADGESHAGQRAYPPVIIRRPERMWRLQRR